jgi:hypothetical protein
VLHLRGKTIEFERVEAEKAINKIDRSKSEGNEDTKSATSGES